MTRVGKCPNCQSGYLVLRKGKFGRFIACDTYPNCNTTFSLPSMGFAEVTQLTCEHCQHPVVRIIRKGKRPQEVCINQNCPSKVVTAEFHEHPCTKCGEGTIILRKSIYGSFGACNKFPKCRTLERIGKPAWQRKKEEKEAQLVNVPGAAQGMGSFPTPESLAGKTAPSAATATTSAQASATTHGAAANATTTTTHAKHPSPAAKKPKAAPKKKAVAKRPKAK
jgi:ssDNA-binding Zn-finger/Zn-ribbon topoisomerase 1